MHQENDVSRKLKHIYRYIIFEETVLGKLTSTYRKKGIPTDNMPNHSRTFIPHQTRTVAEGAGT